MNVCVIRGPNRPPRKRMAGADRCEQNAVTLKSTGQNGVVVQPSATLPDFAFLWQKKPPSRRVALIACEAATSKNRSSGGNTYAILNFRQRFCIESSTGWVFLPQEGEIPHDTACAVNGLTSCSIRSSMIRPSPVRSFSHSEVFRKVFLQERQREADFASR